MSNAHRLAEYVYLFDGKHTAQEISVAVNVDVRDVYNYANSNKLPLRKQYLTTGMKYEINKMLRDGKGGAEIAAALNCEVTMVNKYTLELAKEKRNAKRRSKKREMTADIKELLSSGDTVKEIVEKTGYKKDSVYAIIRQNKWKINSSRAAYQFADQEKEYVSRMPFLTNIELLRILGKHAKCDIDSVRKEMRVEKERYYDKEVIEAIVNEGVGEAAEIYGIDEDILSNMTYAYDFGLCPIKDIEISVPVRLKIRMEAAEVDFMLKGGDFNDEG